ncbi:hypothetical protein ACJMK2_033520 [Sinanodonta woodiana]|uniref:MPN domain-containing protein n=1 Tax=Sinanodonta woodiana TaxID=1069815 RepID=A0ABD3WNL5_SINWO
MAFAKGLPFLENIHDPATKVKELCTYAGQVQVENAVPPRRYLRSGQEMLRMAQVYQSEGELESAFILYMKFITLFVEKLPKHPDYSTAPASDVLNMKTQVKKVFPIAENLKAQLKVKFTEMEKKRSEQEKKLAEENLRIQQLNEEERKKHEEELARLRKETDQKLLHEQEERYRELQEQERRRRKNDINFVPTPVDDSFSSGLNNQRGQVSSGTVDIVHNDLGTRSKIEKNLVGHNVPQIPDRELKRNLVISDTSPTSSPSLPYVDRGTKPSPDHFLSTGVSGANKYGLKDVFIPQDTAKKFLVLAQENTDKNIETGGILAGTLKHHAFHITHLIVPKQHGTSDTFSAENEEAIFDYQTTHDLLSLGWIHTHPSQTAFLSSVDLHTHLPYQLLMPEAIAIVCSPTYNEIGIFMISPDKGVPEISNCSQRGFHEHSKIPPLFEDCSHTKFVDTEQVTVVDLRSV